MIQLQGIRKTFTRPGTDDVQALRDVSIRIDHGELVAIVGASGSGKSTLMNVLGLLEQPTDGTYLLDGKDMAALGLDEQAQMRNRRIGFVFQAFRLLPRTRAIENVELPLIYSDRPSIKNLAASALASVGLQDRSNHYPSELSGGQQQRVAIARAIVNEPDIILADEPTGNLDQTSAQEILSLFLRLHQEGRTIAIVTHDNDVARKCPRTIRLEDGRVTADDKNCASEDAP